MPQKHSAAPEAATTEQRSRDGGYLPIEEYALIGDGLTSALVARDGSIDWACFPRVDSPSVFARILDARHGGAWQVSPTDRFTSHRTYVNDTAILSTVFTTDKGEVELIDFMPPYDAGPTHPWDNAIIRIARGRKGSVRLRSEFEPRFDYNRQATAWTLEARRGLRASSDAGCLTLYSAVPMEVAGERAHGTFAVDAGTEVPFLLMYTKSASLLWRSDLLAVIPELLEDAERYWRRWIGRCTYEGPHSAIVRRSALTLKLLDYTKTGAIVAAPTTSLPEKIGGVRNWDYRYSWLRDTAFTLYALFAIGFRQEAEAFLGWILDSSRGDPKKLQVLYGVEGESRIDEFELDHLEGYRESRPVRIGNAAYDQLQLDIYGDLVDCAFLLHKQDGDISEELWRFITAVVEYVREIWTQPDEGIWEVRCEPRHFVYSKALCWVALDRAIKLAQRRNLPAPLDAWEQTRTAIFDELMREGYNEQLGSFTQSYGAPDLDASALAILLRKVLPANDPRMQSTVDRIASDLARDGLLHRYFADDGLPGEEGAFMLCSFWLVDCYAEMGRVREARELFDRLLGYSNDVGLYSEELDPETGHHLGNFPQGFTHIGVINAAVALQRAERASGTGG